MSDADIRAELLAIEPRVVRAFCLWLAARTEAPNRSYHAVDATALIDRARILESFVAHGASGSATASAGIKG